MAIIIDKIQKKKDIALSCKLLILENGIHALSIAELAKSAGIGKGTFYEYFKNKDELIFEIVILLMEKHNLKKEFDIANASTVKDKIKVFYNFFYSEEDRELRIFYKDFIATSLINPQEERKIFQSKCFDYYYQWLEQIIEESIRRNEIIPESKKLLKGLFAIGEGMFISSLTTYSIDNLEKELNRYIDTLFTLITIKETK